MSTNEPDRSERKTPWVIGILAIVIFAIATYLNYGGSIHFGTATDISATRVGNNVE
jgi:hypothetical protein